MALAVAALLAFVADEAAEAPHGGLFGRVRVPTTRVKTFQDVATGEKNEAAMV